MQIKVLNNFDIPTSNAGAMVNETALFLMTKKSLATSALVETGSTSRYVTDALVMKTDIRDGGCGSAWPDLAKILKYLEIIISMYFVKFSV